MKHTILTISVFLALSAPSVPAFSAIPVPDVNDGREASFLPPPVKLTPEGTIQTTPEAKTQEESPPVKLDNLTQTEKKEITPPSLSEPPPFTSQPAKTEATPKVVEGSPLVTTQPPALSPEKPTTVDLGAPVSAKPLAQIDPEAVGLLAQDSGGLGASLWKDTSRALVDKLLPALGLPTASPTLNDLARRLLLTTAAVPDVPESYKSDRSLTALRAEKLLALGDVQEAWKLIGLVDPSRIDAITLRLLTEAALVGPESGPVCEKIPGFMAANSKGEDTGLEWQKALIICKLRAKDDSAAQLGLDLLREQGAKDDVFLTLMNRNVLGGIKQLPRQLTPLRATNLAALRQLDLPLPPELYARPDAALIPELLLTKGKDDSARLALAERSAAKGLISAAQLAATYKSAIFTPEEIAGAFSNQEKTPRSRALTYQAVFHEQLPQKKIELAQKMLDGIDAEALTGGLVVLAAELVQDIAPSSDYNTVSAAMARLMALAGKTSQAQEWLKIVRGVTDRLPEIGKDYKKNWPLFVLSGLVPDGEYADGLKNWVEQTLAPDEAASGRAQREKAGRVLLILAASGYAVPDALWTRVIEALPPSKQMVAAPILTERLNVAAEAGRKGETVLLSLLIATDGASAAPLSAVTDTLRALRQVGLKAEAMGLAREAIAGHL